MFQARLVALVRKKAVDILCDRVVLDIAETIKSRYYSGKLLVNGQRKAPKLGRQRLLVGGELADGLWREEALVGPIGALQMTQAALVGRWILDLGDETRGVPP